jgi:hypothetical protein
MQQIKCFICLQAAHCLDKALLKGELATPTTIKEAEHTAQFISFLFNREVNPLAFIRPVETTIDESIEEYNDYKRFLQSYPYDRHVMESFSKWYTHTGFETVFLKCNMMYIIHFGHAICEKNLKLINDDQLIERFNEIIKAGKAIFGCRPKTIMQAFLKAVSKFDEIENKIHIRKEANYAY